MWHKQFIQISILLIITLHCTVVDAATADTSVDPQKPRQCYSCHGINCYRTTLTNVRANCTDTLDICVTIFNENAVVAKGCLYDIPEEYRSKCENRNNRDCQRCFGQLCNNLGRSDVKCIDCNSADNSKCADDTSDLKPIQCGIPTAPNSYCYVEMISNNIKRGCLTNVLDQVRCLKNNTCSMCISEDGEACNSYSIKTSGARQINLFAGFSVLIMIMLFANFSI